MAHLLKRPIDIARRLGISTSALRHYEERGLIPAVAYGANGYRKYTETHIAYFECIEAMAPGFGMDIVSQALLHVQSGEPAAALWLINEAQAALQIGQKAALAAVASISALQAEAAGAAPLYSIGEASRLTGLPGSAIRYWESQGLISSQRGNTSGYRQFSAFQLRKIELLRALRHAVYSPRLVALKDIIRQLTPDEDSLRRLARTVEQFFDQLLLLQARGSHSLYSLCRLLKLAE